MKRLFATLILIGAVLGINGCGGGGSSGGTTSTSSTIVGNVVEGYLSGATITFYALSSDGTRGSTLGTGTTDSSGNFSVSLSPAPTTAFLAESSGGSYVDEATSLTVNLTSSDHLCTVLPAGTTSASVNALTNIACVRAIAAAGNGVDLDDAVASANAGVAAQFNLSNIIAVLPVAATNSSDSSTASLNSRLYGIVLAGISQEASTMGVSAHDLATALATDASDGTLDGMDSSGAIMIPNSAVTLGTAAGLSDLQTGITTFLGSTGNKTSVTTAQVGITATPIGINTAGTLYTTTAALPAWTYDVAGSAQISVSGGTGPYSCTLKSGSLPANLSLGSDCTISGTIPSQGNNPMTIFNPFTVTITDSATTPASIDVPIYVTVIAAAPTLVPVSSGSCYAGMSCSVQIATATGGTPSYYYTSDTFANGAPPMGMVIGTDGYLTGTAPSSEGTYSFAVCVVDSVGAEDCGTTSITVKSVISKFDGSYSGSISGSTSGNQFGDFAITGGSSVTVTSGSISGSATGTATSGALTGSIDANGAVTMGIASTAECPASFTGTVTIDSNNGASGSGTWSCTINSGIGGGTASGTWSVTRQ